ncbi:Succinate-semialdehyde dehydrogenase (acetylating) [Pluralibacter gergoviae]|nr:Succinate-semialdehyde dehydrogenase (acetylating) [Pluralibacter gergoviae]
MNMDQKEIENVVRAVIASMTTDAPAAPKQAAGQDNGFGVFASLDDAVAAASAAHGALKTVEMRKCCIEAIRQAGVQHARELAELAVEETGMGRVEDKVAKNIAQAKGTPGVECLRPEVLTGDRGLTLIENAPWGVIASVTPSTNPAATVINNAISMIAGGNSVVFAPAPGGEKGLPSGHYAAQQGDSRRRRPQQSAGDRRRTEHRDRAAPVSIRRHWPAGSHRRRCGGGVGPQAY